MSSPKDTTSEQVTSMLAAGDARTLTTTRDAAARFIMPLVAAGLPIIPLYPNSKRPALLSNWQRTPVTAEAWDQWLDDAYARGTGDGTAAVLGLGLRAGTRMLVADADTPDEVDALEQFFTARGLPAVGPTVTTPGTADRAHHAGGHWWFLLPDDVAVPAGLPGVLTVDAAGRTGNDTRGATFDLFLHSKQAALPPTVRDPGRYELTGQVYDLPDAVTAWLREKGIAARAENTAAETRRAERAAARAAGELNPELDDWEDTTSWSAILETAGWTESGADAACGCTQWRHPQASSTKSATAHDCARGTYLHLWSSSCRDLELGSYSKLFVDAALHHGGDYAAAARAAGLPPKTNPIETLDLAARMAEINESRAAEAGVDVDDPDVPEVPYDEAAYPLGHPNNPRLMERIFNFNPVTRAIYHSARSRPVYTSPMTLLLSELIRAGRYSTQGSRTEIDDQLSMYVALCARSGGGKSVAMSMMQRPSIFLRGGAFLKNQEAAAPRGDLVVGGLASGQAMIDGLAEEVLDAGDEDEGRKPEKVLKMRTPAVLTIIEDELDNLAAKSQSGSTLSNTVLSAWSCGTIGDLSRTHGMRMINGVDDPYTVYLVGGIQPARASSMVGRAAVSSGLAQRVFFLATEDPWFDDPVLGKPRPDAAVIDAPADDENMRWDNDRKQFTLPAIPVSATVSFCEEMHHAMRLQNLHTARGDQDPRDTHLTRIRFRLACLMALHSGQRHVSSEVWEWTSALMEHRRLTLAFVEAGAEAAAQDEADEREARQETARYGAKDATPDAVAEVSDALLAKIPGEGITSGRWRATITPRRRRFFDAAVTELEREGRIVREPAGSGGVRFRRMG